MSMAMRVCPAATGSLKTLSGNSPKLLTARSVIIVVLAA